MEPGPADGPASSPAAHRVTVVVVTRDRCDQLAIALGHLVAPDGPTVIVVDNGSTDGTVDMVRADFPSVELLVLAENLGGAGRNLGVALSSTPYVAFSDDDSWWAAGSLDAAVRVLDGCPDVAVVTGPVLVGRRERLDPTSSEMAESPLPRRPEDPGPSVLGFLACGAVLRADPFLDVGGFDPEMGVGGEEELLTLDLAAAGWRLHYVDTVVAHHHPAARSLPSASGRQRREARNALRTVWLRLPVALAVRETGSIVRRAIRTSGGRRGIADAVSGARELVGRRHVVPAGTAALRRRLVVGRPTSARSTADGRFRSDGGGKDPAMASDEQDQAEALDDDEMAGEFPPDRLLGANQYGVTAAEERWDEPLEERISREEPDFGEDEVATGETGFELVGIDDGDGILAGEVVDGGGIGGELPIADGDIAFGDSTTRDVVLEREAPLDPEEAAMHIEEP